MIKLIQPDWPAPKNVFAGTTTRQGAYSQGPYSSFNLGDHVGDNAEAVLNNRQLLQSRCALPSSPIWLQQIHSDNIVEATTNNLNVKADASWTEKAGQVCAVLTADCLPLLICNKQGTRVAAIHAGWRGLALGVVERSLEKLAILPEDTLVWLGPAMSQKAFEVGKDVLDAFTQNYPADITCFKATKPEKWLADIYELARNRLHRFGIKQIFGGEYCTYGQTELFFSYRRDATTGRMASFIYFSTVSDIYHKNETPKNHYSGFHIA